MTEEQAPADAAGHAARDALADAALVGVDQAYAAFLDADQRADVRRRIGSLLNQREGLRRAKLSNGDAPAWPAPPSTAGTAPSAPDAPTPDGDAPDPTPAAPPPPLFGAGAATSEGSAPGSRVGPRTERLASATISELGRLLRRGETTPIELAELALDRLEQLGPRLNAVVALTRERARREARQAEAELAAGHDRGPLHGIPYGAKDLLATGDGVPTSWGAAPFRDQQFAEDAAVLRRLEAAGAVLVAKLAMVELAGGFGYDQPDASFSGPGLNPWNPEHWSGGSSSGSGSAVGAALVPFAIGSETWGSIMTPAAMCGVAGLRPTYGRVPTRGAMVLSWSLDKLGPLCRSAFDCGLALEAMAGPDPADPADRIPGWRFDRAGWRRPLRLAVPRALADDERLQPDVRGRFGEALAALRRLAAVEEVDLPDLPVVEATQTVLAAELGSAFEEFIAAGGPAGLTAPEDRAGGYANAAVRAVDYLRAMRIRGQAAHAYTALLAPFDAIVSPTLAGVGARIGEPFSTSRWAHAPAAVRDLGAAGNLLGLPAISVPSGLSGEGLPTAIAFIGRFGAEQQILNAAIAYQAHAAVDE